MIKLKVEKSVDLNGKKQITIAASGIKSARELPDEYLTGYPMIRYVPGYLNIELAYRAVDTTETEIGLKRMNPEDAEKLIALIQAAGERLHKINQRITRERAVYSGTSEITI